MSPSKHLTFLSAILLAVGCESRLQVGIDSTSANRQAAVSTAPDVSTQGAVDSAPGEPDADAGKPQATLPSTNVTTVETTTSTDDGRTTTDTDIDVTPSSPMPPAPPAPPPPAPTPPVPGDNGNVGVTNVSNRNVTVHFSAAAPQSGQTLKYRVYYSPSNDIATVADAEVNGTPVGPETTSVTDITVPNLDPGRTYYFTIVVTNDAGLSSIYAMQSAQTVNFDWIGSTRSAPSSWSTTAELAAGRGDGDIGIVHGVASAGGQIYVADGANTSLDHNRIIRFDAATGAATGWTGGVRTVPTGGAPGCTSLTVGAATNAWCTGGEGQYAPNGSGPLAPRGITVDAANTYVYAASSAGNRIERIDAVTGAFAGWVGSIQAPPTGGMAGCAGAPVDTMTPGWCIGGNAGSGVVTSGSGSLNGPNSIHLAASGYLYVADGQCRLARYNAASGIFAGWIGYVMTTPTGGDAGCTATAANARTPGWCTGGNATCASGIADPLWDVTSITSDGAGYLYVTQGQFHNVLRIKESDGTFRGWAGRVATTPSSGSAGCNTAPVDSATPGWCFGGTAKAGNGDGMFDSPGGVLVDGAGYLLVADSNNHRLVKLDAATGTSLGWFGKVAAQPAGGDAGCSSATVGSLTPGWCIGGTSRRGENGGGLGYPTSLALAGNRLLVGMQGVLGHSGHSRLASYDATTMTFQGWAGSKVIPSSSWHASGTAVASAASGTLFAPSKLVSHNGDAYVLDCNGTGVCSFALRRFALATGTDRGWIGLVGDPPSGGDSGCAGATPGSFTPGWCLGGRASYGLSTNGAFTAWGTISIGAGSLYVAEFGMGLGKFDLATGAFVGWTGVVNGAPTGGAAGCSSTGAGAPTPGWCRGGSRKSSPSANATDGIYFWPAGVHADAAGKVYLSDKWYHRVARYDGTTGVFEAWIGRIKVSPTGGVAGCAGGAVGDSTPGWCTGGEPQAGTNEGSFNSPEFLASDGTYLYVQDYGRITRFLLTTGAADGWIGATGATAPTGGATGCTTAAANTLTPGWCRGGTTGNAFLLIDRALSSTAATHVDVVGGYLYVAGATALHRFNLATGVYAGWRGAIATSPTGGDPGCAGAAVGSTTPGWCIGGTAAAGSQLGAFGNITGITTDADRTIYVSDSGNARVTRIQ